MFFIFFLFMELLLPFSAFHVHQVLKPFLSKHNLELKEGHVYQGRQYITRHFENDNEFNIILQIYFQNQLNHPCFKVWIWVTLNTKNGTKNPLELRVKESVLPLLSLGNCNGGSRVETCLECSSTQLSGGLMPVLQLAISESICDGKEGWIPGTKLFSMQNFRSSDILTCSRASPMRNRKSVCLWSVPKHMGF
jgi:hypothetical protein